MALDCLTNSPHQHHRKCIKNSMENFHTGVRVQRTKGLLTVEVYTAADFRYMIIKSIYSELTFKTFSPSTLWSFVFRILFSAFKAFMI